MAKGQDTQAKKTTTAVKKTKNAVPKAKVAPKAKAPEKAKVAPKTKAQEKAKIAPKAKSPVKTKVAPKAKSPAKTKAAPKAKAPEKAKVAPKAKSPAKTKAAPKAKAPEKAKVAPKAKSPAKTKAAPKAKAPEKTKVDIDPFFGAKTVEVDIEVDVASEATLLGIESDDDEMQTDESSKNKAEPKSGTIDNTFRQFDLKAPVIKALDKMGYEKPTEVQATTIPFLLDGKDVIGQARTGTGKTAAFGIPMANNLPEGAYSGITGVVLTPTRELCRQVAAELSKICAHKALKVVAVFGGQNIKAQTDALDRGCQIIVGTPGRTMDLMRRKYIDLSKVKMLVLDEADEMLDMGFVDDIRWILRHTPKKRQTLLFSATMPRAIRKLAEFYLRSPRIFNLSSDAITSERTEQLFFQTEENDKFEALCDLLDQEKVGLGLLFCRTKKSTNYIGAKLKARGFDAHILHGGLSQGERTRTMDLFRNRDMQLLVATDVAARGIDVSNVTHVINYELPRDPEVYVHRIGRTGRIGTKGRALSLISPGEFYDLHAIQDQLKIEIAEGFLPDRAEVESGRRSEELRNYLTEIDKADISPYIRLMDDAEDFLDIKETAAALFKLLHETRCAGGMSGFFGNTGASKQSNTRFQINRGRQDNLSVEQLVQLLAEVTELSEDFFTGVRIHDRYSFVEVPLSQASVIYEKLSVAELEPPLKVKPAIAVNEQRSGSYHGDRKPDGDRNDSRSGNRFNNNRHSSGGHHGKKPGKYNNNRGK
jgi:ATP-dependent RNA helicase DeaD